jgi:hypothetical protein
MKIIIFLTIWIGLILLLSPEIIPDLSKDDQGYENTRGIGHPLWNDN